MLYFRDVNEPDGSISTYIYSVAENIGFGWANLQLETLQKGGIVYKRCEMMEFGNQMAVALFRMTQRARIFHQDMPDGTRLRSYYIVGFLGTEGNTPLIPLPLE